MFLFGSLLKTIPTSPLACKVCLRYYFFNIHYFYIFIGINYSLDIRYMAISFLMHIQGFSVTFLFLDSWQILCACKMGLIWSSILWKPSFWKQIYQIQPNMTRMVVGMSSFKYVSYSLAFNQRLQQNIEFSWNSN